AERRGRRARGAARGDRDHRRRAEPRHAPRVLLREPPRPAAPPLPLALDRLRAPLLAAADLRGRQAGRALRASGRSRGPEQRAPGPALRPAPGGLLALP